MVTELTTDSTKLVLRTDASLWCHVSLTHAGRSYELGAETLALVVQRLLLGLQDDLRGSEKGTIDGLNVVGVLSLAERHASVYAAHQDGTRMLYFQNADGGLIARVDLREEQRRQWIAVLEGRQ